MMTWLSTMGRGGWDNKVPWPKKARRATCKASRFGLGALCTSHCSGIGCNFCLLCEHVVGLLSMINRYPNCSLYVFSLSSPSPAYPGWVCEGCCARQLRCFCSPALMVRDSDHVRDRGIRDWGSGVIWRSELCEQLDGSEQNS